MKIILLLLLLFSCKGEVQNDVKKFRLSNKFNTFDYNIRGDSLIKMLGIELVKNGQNKYKFSFECESNIDQDSLKKNYYVIINLYPYDKDINGLTKRRIKYGFESFSCSFKISQLQKLTAERIITTNCKDIRGLVISLFDFKNKKKHQEFFFENIKLD